MLRVPGGAGPELARRWLAALLVAPPDERESIVSAIEMKMVETYVDGPRDERPAGENEQPALQGEPLRVTTEPVQRSGYVEQVMRTYAASDAKRKKKGAGAGKRRSAS
ncbi:MAG TPA: hypothetical protein VG797_05775 [Phycisphaerales bacterium]|nr:hypothetical protein [Phycisphaerales bacterium]